MQVQTIANQGKEGMQTQGSSSQETMVWDFPGGPVVKNPPDNAGDIGLIPGPGRAHIFWGNLRISSTDPECSRAALQ